MALQIPDRMRQSSRMKLDVVELSERSAAQSFSKLVFEKLGEDGLDDWTVSHDNILVATYIKPRKTAGGIILPEKSVDEDRYQGKVGLVLKIGETAFKGIGTWNPEKQAFIYTGTIPKKGQYINFHSSDTREQGFRGLSLKYIKDQLYLGIIPERDIDDIY